MSSLTVWPSSPADMGFEIQAPVISDTHPGLFEAVGPPAVVGVVRDVLGLLELLPQPLYPVVVARG